MGITNVAGFLGGNGDISAFLDHIEYVAKKFGTDHVTIGTDRGYRSVGTDAERAQLPKQNRLRTRWEALWPPNDKKDTPEYNQAFQAESLMWTNWPLFTVGLVQRGFSDADIRKIIGGNILRVAHSVFPY